MNSKEIKLIRNIQGKSGSETAVKGGRILKKPTSKNQKKTRNPLRDRAIFMGIRDREICNGTTRYFGLSVGRGHRLF